MSRYRINIDGKMYEMEIECMDEAAATLEESRGSVQNEEKSGSSLSYSAKALDSSSAKKITAEGSNIVYSPMPGTIIGIFAKNGDRVKKGQAILILEAMKMENEITAPSDGIVDGLNVAEKQIVQGGVALFEIMD